MTLELSLLEATVVCVALVVLDLLARAWRIQWIVQGLGYPMGFWDSFVVNAYGDAACALTPLRIGSAGSGLPALSSVGSGGPC